MMNDERRKRAILAAIAVAEEKIKPLSREERASLCEIGRPLGRLVPADHWDTLIAAGLVKQVLGGLKLTDIGEAAAHVLRSASL